MILGLQSHEQYIRSFVSYHKISQDYILFVCFQFDFNVSCILKIFPVNKRMCVEFGITWRCKYLHRKENSELEKKADDIC